jgi:hypothetical protein
MSGPRPAIAAGLAVTLLGAIPLMWLTSALSQEAAAPVTTQHSANAVVPPVTSDPIVIEAQPPEIPGLSESITRVLSTNGFASVEHLEEVPESVVRVLSERGIALTIAEAD